MVSPTSRCTILDVFENNGFCKFRREHPVRVLSVDGGGLRGIIPMELLANLEGRTHLPVCKLFDLTMGTSTGGIGTLALSIPKEEGSDRPKFSAKEISQLYAKRATEIFPPQPIWKKPLAWFKALDAPKYDTAGLEKVMDEYCGDVPLSAALIPAAVTTFEMTEFKLWYFLSTDPFYASLKMKDAILAATAAPTYFLPKPLTFGESEYAFIDGGVCANAPSVCVYTLAKKLFNQSDDKYLVLSLGTGVADVKIPYNSSNNWGLYKWTPRILDLLLQAGSVEAHKQMSTLFPDTGSSKDYYHFQVSLPENHYSLDDSSPENIAYLEGVAQEMIENNDEQLRTLSRRLEIEVDARDSDDGGF